MFGLFLKNIKYFFCILFFLFFYEVKAQQIDSFYNLLDSSTFEAALTDYFGNVNVGELKLSTPLQVFFKDNEYKRKIAYGYTLCGFRLKPNLEYKSSKNLIVAMGINVLRYWGANEYGSYNFVSVPYYTDANIQHQVHIKPYLRVTYKPIKSLTFILGDLDNSTCHNFNAPLYNSELLYSADDEEGLQLIYDCKYGSTDIWVNWQNFNFVDDVDREALLAGASGYGLMKISDYDILKFNYGFMWQHHGGELDTLDLPLDHWTNMRLGLEYKKSLICLQCENYFNIGVDYYYSKALKNDTWYFSSGHAWYPHIGFARNKLSTDFGYFYSKDFISLYGNAFYSNIAQRDKTIYYPKNKMLTASLSYKVGISDVKNSNYDKHSKYNLYFFTELYYKTDDCNSLEKETKSLSFAVGVRFAINDTFHLINVRK